MTEINKIKSLILKSTIFPNPTRFNIITTLILMGSTKFSTLHEILGLTRGNLGYHLQKLQDLGWVSKLPKNSHQQYTLTPIAIVELSTALKKFSLVNHNIESVLQKSKFKKNFKNMKNRSKSDQ